MCIFDLSHTASLNDVEFNIKLESMDEPQSPSMEYGYSNTLNKYRNFIDNIKPDDWKKVRWYINNYDFLVKDPIINRAFYKYWEIINEFEIFEGYSNDDIVLHCAEAPGGFIQGTNIYLQVDRVGDLPKSHARSSIDEEGFITVHRKRKRPGTEYKVYTISLNKDLPQYKSYNLPSYNKNVINKHVCITYGQDKTGDINNWDNILHINKIARRPFYLVTADGGFDEGTDFNNKEQLHFSLILSEIAAAIRLQKHKGHFILKVFDVFTETSLHLMYLLSIAYESVHVYKPKTSRPTNSEKYLVCKGFRLDEEQRVTMFEKLFTLYKRIQTSDSKYNLFTIFKNIPTSFIQKISDMNKVMLEKQCNSLQIAVELCNDSDFLENYEKRLNETIEKRKRVFHEWEALYNLGSFV
jgi:23S rRNA U2552 (ribose-2'-O)-methylase RlmE/FtsJ